MRRSVSGRISVVKVLIAQATFAFLVLLAHGPWYLCAQTTNAAINGQITDAQGQAVPGADVQVVNIDTAVVYFGKTNSSGVYVVPAIPPGRYRMVVRKEGFKEINKTNLVLNVQDTLEQNFALEVGSVAESITVEAGGLNINTTDATVSMVVDRTLVENLPLNGRSFQQLITLAPGVNLTGGPTSNNYGEFSVNGQRPTSNYFTVDGVSANLGATLSGGTVVGSSETLNAAGGTSSLVSVDALQEFRILTSSFAPEYGRTPGAQVILLTRSGTNDFHGTLFEYFRNDVLDANDWFANRAGSPRSALRFNNFGGTVGGPIVKEKTFFFFSYEGDILRQPQFGIDSVPDMASRQMAPAAVQPFLNGFPIPNGPELGRGLAEFSAGYSNPIDTHAASLRLDHVFGPKLSAFARYNYAPSSISTRGGDSEVLSGFLHTSLLAQSATVGVTYSLTSRVVNESRLNWSANRAILSAGLDNFGGAAPPPAATLFIPPFTPGNELAQVTVGFPVRYLVGAFVGSIPRQVSLLDNISYLVGTHQLKVGVDYLRSLPINRGFGEDEYNFSSVANAVNNKLGFLVADQAQVRSDATNLSLYAQDSWKISSRLTLTYGVRWDLNPPPRDRYPNNGNYVPLVGNYTTGDVSVGTAGSSLWNTQYDNFAPRVGLAYRLFETPGRETVIRVGGGLFYDVATEEMITQAFNTAFPNTIDRFSPGVSVPIDPSLAVLPTPSLTNPTPGSEFNAYPRDLAAPRTWQWNVSIQQALGSIQSITASYVGAVGRNLLYQQSFPSVGPNGYQVLFTDNSAQSNYQSLQLQYQRRLSHGFAGTITYALSHSLDDSSSNITLLPPGSTFAPHSNWGSSDFDIRHSFKAALSWNIPSPVGPRWVRALGSDWGLDGIIVARSALPVDIGSFDNNVLGGFTFQLRPDIVPGQPFYLYGAQFPGGKAFNPAAFVVNPNDQGDLGRNSLRGFNLVQTDLSLRRTFHIGERYRLLFRVDSFNIFNHPNFADPDPIIDDGTFGQSLGMANTVLGGGSGSSLNSVFQVGGPRTLQISLKFLF